MMKRLLGILLSLMLLTCTFTALGEDAPAEPAAEETAEAPAEPVLLVTVNGEGIATDNASLQNVISYYMDYAANYGYDTTSPDMIQTINQ